MTRRGGNRLRRVDEAVKQVLSEEIPRLKDPRVGFVTVTGVDITSDLEHAQVWVSVYGTERQRRETLRALAGAAGLLQARINSELHLRRTPQLAFAYDPSVERGMRMTQLIDEVAPAAVDAPAESEGESEGGDDGGTRD